MISGVMVYIAVASILVAVGAACVEGFLRAWKLPQRFLWAASMALIVGMVMLAGAGIGRSRTEYSAASDLTAEGAQAPGAGLVAPAPSNLATLRAEIERVVQLPIVSGVRLAERHETSLRVGWVLMSLALIGCGAATIMRYHRRRARWPLTEVNGTRVRIAPSAGPAVMGLIRPEIVIPHWLLSSSAEERRLAILHEGEHVRAKDSLLLAAGCVVAALIPWNPAVWWMLLRLRLAVEVDCDHRVLRTGVERRKYGSMLIDVSGHGSGLSFGVPALAGFPSTLERRLVAMTTNTTRSFLIRRGAIGLAGCAALFAACEAHLPTAADINALDANRAEDAARGLGLIDAADSTIYIVNNVEVSADVAQNIAPEEIVRVEVSRMVVPDGPTTGQVSILTREGEGLLPITVTGYARAGGERVVIGSALAGEVAESRTVIRGDTVVIRYAPRAGDDRLTMGAALAGGAAGEDAAPMFIVDGEVMEYAQFNNISPQDIQSISVLKNEAALARYDDPRARNGVVLVVTKK